MGPVHPEFAKWSNIVVERDIHCCAIGTKSPDNSVAVVGASTSRVPPQMLS